MLNSQELSNNQKLTNSSVQKFKKKYQSMFLAQIANKSHKYDRQNTEQQLIQQQKTLRFNQCSPQFRQETEEKNEDLWKQFIIQLSQLQYEKNLKTEAIAKAQTLIQGLEQENANLKLQIQAKINNFSQCLEQRNQLQGELLRMKKLIQVSSTSQASASTSVCYNNILNEPPKSQKNNGKITPIKLFTQSNANATICQQTLSQIKKISIQEYVQEVTNERQEMKVLLQEEEYQFLELQRQNNFLRNYLQDQILNKGCEANIQYQSKQYMQQTVEKNHIYLLNQAYQRLLNNWESYANSLKFCLHNCLQFIQQNHRQRTSELHNHQQVMFKPDRIKQVKLKNQDLIEFIRQDVMQIIFSFNEKLLLQNNELKSIMDELITKIYEKKSVI